VAAGLLAGEHVLPVFASSRLWWMCMALPGSFSIGLARKVA
jgi:hypothetical protein